MMRLNILPNKYAAVLLLCICMCKNIQVNKSKLINKSFQNF